LKVILIETSRSDYNINVVKIKNTYLYMLGIGGCNKNYMQYARYVHKKKVMCRCEFKPSEVDPKYRGVVRPEFTKRVVRLQM